MVTFTCKDNFEAILTCVYEAWASKLGHKNVRLMLEPVWEPELFTEYRPVAADAEKAQRVAASIRKKISPAAFSCAYAACLHTNPKKADILYRFLIYGFHFGPKALDLLGEPAVSQFFSLSGKVQNEAHFYREFTRFASVPPGILFGIIEPKCDVLTLLAPHFMDRMPSEHWMIADKGRLSAVVHPKNEDFYLTALSASELARMEEASAAEDPFVPLWKSFFHSVSIQQRQNEKCRRTLLPLWYRKHMTEFL